MMPAYLDCNATTPVEKEVAREVHRFLVEEFGNPASPVHMYGTIARMAVDEMPDYLAVRIFAIADLMTTPRPGGIDIEKLIEHVKLYDTYGQTGYLGMGVNHLILEKTIRQIEEQLGVCPTIRVEAKTQKFENRFWLV